ncbi:MAG: hypothetical protein ACUVV4_03335 [Candidatus Bathyarchaeia archaeon]
MRVKVEISLPVEILEEMDTMVELIGFEDRSKFVEASVRKLLDQYRVTLGRAERKRLKT